MPWLGDAVSLVDAFRRKELSPREALDDCLAAIDASDLYGNPGLSIPAGTGLPVGLQVMGRHHTEPLLLDLGLLLERERPWPLVAPGSPR